MAGFYQPIIHGLCSYSVVCKAVVDNLLGGDTSRITRCSARFSGVGLPGETYAIDWWRKDDTIFVHASSKERGDTILSNGALFIRGEDRV